MNKKNLLTYIILPLISLSCFSCAGDSNSSTSSLEFIEESENILDDNYRNIYEIMPISFADSNKDGKGDLTGIKDKLSYIKNMGFTGLWLTPVHSSPTYHKYDVNDYKSIDSAFGTLDDYDALVTACHDNNMTILLDLVLNHTSTANKWFTTCMYDHIRNKTDDQYYNYYNVVKIADSGIPSGYSEYNLNGSGTGFAYECRFWSGMPDLNLKYAMEENSYLGKDIIDILSFWLVDHKVDGFRLDAVTSYFTGNTDGNLEFLTWLNNQTKKIKSDAYIVGEAWTSPGEISKYYGSGTDSFFAFQDAKIDGYIAQTVINNLATSCYNGMKENIEISGKYVPAPFVANHDTGRFIGAVHGVGASERIKFGNAVLSIMNGCTYSYYGDEIGMATLGTIDEDKRQPIAWGDDYTCKPVSGSTRGEDSEKYPFGTVADQLTDSNSIINFITKCNKLRNEIPEIARGSVSLSYKSDDDSFAIIKKDYNNKSIYLMVNASIYPYSFEFKDLDYTFKSIAGELLTTGEVTTTLTDITIPAQSIVALR